MGQSSTCMFLLWTQAFFIFSLRALHLQFNIHLEAQLLLQSLLFMARASLQQNCCMENAETFQPFPPSVGLFHSGIYLNHILMCPLSLVVFKVWDQRHQYHLSTCQKNSFPGLRPDGLILELRGPGPAICIFSSPRGDSDAH